MNDTSNEEVVPLKANIDSNDEDWQAHDKGSYRPWRQRIRKWSLFSTFLLLVASLALYLVMLFSVRQREEDIGYRRVYSPLWDVVKYQNVQFHAQFGSTSPFKGPVRTELNKAWEDVVRTNLILIDGHEMDALGEPKENATKLGNRYFALVEVFHQLHCVELVRKFVHRDDYPDEMAFEDPEADILEHITALILFAK
ncbi:hypothetical protein BDV39DRAFT_200012 [Aspergillus sergii]|uniref:Tat pathway signal sequence n=1 Tax=Aspergillus sergii TaxID=1034303 RepID=A0A5N6XHU5_9EURO|nr:hypothetical protein BDV39DRAFT_200012 [Aspergillus sergii]